jgi:hypothetical protein
MTGHGDSAFLSIAAMEGIMIGLWFGDHGNALRYFGQSKKYDYTSPSFLLMVSLLLLR